LRSETRRFPAHGVVSPAQRRQLVPPRWAVFRDLLERRSLQPRQQLGAALAIEDPSISWAPSGAGRQSLPSAHR